MKVSLESRNILVTLVLAGGAAAYVFLLFLPMQAQTAVLRDELTLHQDFVSQSASLTTSMTAVDQELSAARDFAAAWRKAAPPGDQLAPTFGGITRCAVEAGLEMLRFDPQPAIALETVTRAPLSLSCSGKFHEIVYFLELLESQPQTIWIDDMLLSAGDAASGKMTCELTLVVFADNREVSH